MTAKAFKAPSWKGRCSGSRFGFLLAVGALLLLTACSKPPEEKLAEFLASGAELFEQGDYPKASVQFRNALQIDQKNVEAWYGLAKVSREQGELKATFDQHVIVTELDKTHVPAQLFVGRAFLVGRQLDRALERSNLLMELAPEDADVRAFRAAVLYQLADVQGAVREANAALEREPNNIHALLLLAAERLAAKDAKAAIAFLDRGLAVEEKNTALNLVRISALNQLEDVDAAVAAFERLITFYPDDRSLRYSLARYLLVNERPDAAEKVFADVVAREPDAVEPKLTMIRFLLQVRGRDAGLAQLKAYIEQAPKVYELRFALGEFYATTDQADAAKAVYQAIVDEAGEGEDGLKARSRLAQLALLGGDTATAERIVGELLALDANNVDGLVLRAGMRSDRGEHDAAIGDLRIALREQPDAARTLVMLARVHRRMGQDTLADDYYVRAIRANPQQSAIALEYARQLVQAQSLSRADQVLEELLARNPNLVEALELQAQVKLSLQQWAEAEALAERIKTAGDRQAAANQILGLALQGQRQFEESIAAFTEAHQAAPTAAQPMVALVRSYVAAGRRDEARVFLEAVVRANADNYAAQFLLGRLYTMDRDFPAARAAFAKAVEINPSLGIGHYALAVVYQLEGDDANAKATLEAGLAQAPDNAALKLTLAGLHERAQAFEEAIPLYERVLERLPDQPVARNNLASILADHRSDPDSLARAMELAEPLADARVPHFRDTLGWIYHRLDRHDEALPILQGVVAEAPEQGVFQYHLGMTYLRTGEREKARAALERAVALGEQRPFTGLEEAKSALDSL